jgi:hypothetical protein
VKRFTVAVWVLTGYAVLTGLRIPAFSSDLALWLAASPSPAPRVSVNIAAALLEAGKYPQAARYALEAVALAEHRPPAEQAAVFGVVRNQFLFMDARVEGTCAQPLYQRFCF